MSSLKTMTVNGEKHFAWEVAYSHEECRFMCEVYAPTQTHAELFLAHMQQYEHTKIIQRNAERVVTSFNHSVQMEARDKTRFWVKEIWTGSASLHDDLMLHIIDIIDTGKVTGSRNTVYKTPA
ncbi:hypothetical protein KAMAJI_00500 [Serratia phage vB_SmaM-Kamaji]|nr:hypothetical protein KAMAJI_00500 [Serratia phage vB_SmaM-Kamaji]